MDRVNGGHQIAEVLLRQGVRFLFTLCGGHISPILVGCKERDIRVIDVRDEANAVFAADGVARLTGVPGVAAVTAGPGVTNTLTALKNAQMAQSPLVLLGGSAATMLKGRGSLQDIDQMAVIAPHVKWAASVSAVKDLIPTVEEAFRRCQYGVPGPVFVEVPIDLLYDEELIRGWYAETAGREKAKSVSQRAMNWYLGRHLEKVFDAAYDGEPAARITPEPRDPVGPLVQQAAAMVGRAERPVLLVGSQALVRAGEAGAVARSIENLGMPCWLAGMARGLLGREHDLHMRHKRKAALKKADLVILAGVPADFRLGYGRVFGPDTKVIAVNLELRTLVKNIVPRLPIPADPGRFLQRLAEATGSNGHRWEGWKAELSARDDARDAEIAELAEAEAPPINPLTVCRAMESAMSDDSVIVADGGDFVGTAAYIVRPRSALRWLDPGVFGTLGVGAGFALAAALVYPDAEVWLVYGDGAAGFSIIEVDTFARHNLGVIMVIGNDAGWTQIARDQIEILKDDVGTVLARSNYERVAQAFGGMGILVKEASELDGAFVRAKRAAAKGRPVVVNCHIGVTDFRKGSISM